MNESENTPQDSSETSVLKMQLAELRRHAGMMQLGLVLVSLTLAAFVGLQARRTAKDLEALRPQANQIIDLNKKETPQIKAIVSQLEAYGKGHPDYAEKVLAKYGVRSTNSATGSAQPPSVPKK